LLDAVKRATLTVRRWAPLTMKPPYTGRVDQLIRYLTSTSR